MAQVAVVEVKLGTHEGSLIKTEPGRQLQRWQQCQLPPPPPQQFLPFRLRFAPSKPYLLLLTVP